MADAITDEKRLLVRLWSARIQADLLKEEVAALRATDAREAVALWMIAHDYPTGHGDTLDDLLSALVAYAREDERDMIAEDSWSNDG